MENYKFMILVGLLLLNMGTIIWLGSTIDDYYEDSNATLGQVCGYALGNE